jgi:hypothetical protein
MKRTYRFALALFASFCAFSGADPACVLSARAAEPDWPQWGGNPQHTGRVSWAAQSLDNVRADILFDPTVETQKALYDGDINAHYQVPLINGNDVFIASINGKYDGSNYGTLRWRESRYRWENGELVKKWEVMSDYVTPGTDNDFWLPVFHGILANGYVYVPGVSGTLMKLDMETGATVARINPFQRGLDAHTYVAGVPAADASGNLYYTAIKLGSNSFYGKDVVDSWLVKVAPNDSTAVASYKVLAAGAPGPKDQCRAAFSTADLPWPPSPDAVPPSVDCGSVRPALNAAPAIATDGTIYTIARNHLISRYGWVVATNPNLTKKWIASMRDRFNDGCGVLLGPSNATPGAGSIGCRVNARTGVDPSDNTPGAGRVLDDSTSSPVVAPDGSIFYGAFTRYNFARGHLMKFGADSSYLGAFHFGWDVTPAIYRHGNSNNYSVVIKNNYYGGLCADFGSYCGDSTKCGERQHGPYLITQLDRDLNVEWSYENTNTDFCRRDANGNVTCEPNLGPAADCHQTPSSRVPVVFEWCINAPAIDANGVVFANSEDGNVFAINQGGTLKKKLFLNQSLGAPYTPIAIGRDGRVYTENAGHMFAIGD